MHTNEDSLNRGLRERHIRLMALGSTIGVGLFLGSASAIKLAGPAILLSYVLGGIAIFIVMPHLAKWPYISQFRAPLAAMRKTIWSPAGLSDRLELLVHVGRHLCPEITAVGIYMGVCFPSVPQWIWALMALAAMSAVNLAAVKAYGEFEFWFAMIKVVTIVVMILAGACMIVFGLGNHGVATGVSNLWKHGGFFPNGGFGMLMALQMVMFADLGVETIGVTAGEATNPGKSIPDRSLRLLAHPHLLCGRPLCDPGDLSVERDRYEWQPIRHHVERLGIKSAAGIINFVVLTAALSSCNGGIYSTGRIL